MSTNPIIAFFELVGWGICEICRIGKQLINDLEDDVLEQKDE